MARRNTGLTIGQSLTLIFGFVLGSVMIFALGIWVGREFSRQGREDERPVVVRPVATLPVRPVAGAAATPPPTGDRTPGQADERPTRPRLVPPTPTATSTQTVAPTRTSTRRQQPTRTMPREVQTPVQTRRIATEASGGMWTVQAATTNDQVQALVAARRLRSKGYDAFTAQTDIGGVIWYRIQVGKFADKKEAEEMAARLRKEGMVAAFPDRIR